MLIRYIARSEPRISQDDQLAIIGAWRGRTYRESEKGADPFEQRAVMLRQIRKGDEVHVSDFHRLGQAVAELVEIIEAIEAKGAVVVEARTGFRSDKGSQLSKMQHHAGLWYARRDPDTLAQRGRDASKLSSASQVKEGRMPPREAMGYLNNHEKYPYLDDALDAINAVKKYGVPWNKPYVYRMRKKGLISLRPRLSGYARDLNRE